jgi:hypothetical protein
MHGLNNAKSEISKGILRIEAVVDEYPLTAVLVRVIFQVWHLAVEMGREK